MAWQEDGNGKLTDCFYRCIKTGDNISFSDSGLLICDQFSNSAKVNFDNYKNHKVRWILNEARKVPFSKILNFRFMGKTWDRPFCWNQIYNLFGDGDPIAFIDFCEERILDDELELIDETK
jgi:hypothetical protein